MQRPNIKKGTLLIARPTLLKDVFHRAVILITDHSDMGTVGFVLNKSIKMPLNKFLGELESSDEVYEGGPVDQENLFYLHTRPDLIKNSEQITDDLYWSGCFEDVLNAINNNLITNNQIRFYLGYSGWSANQLEDEIENNTWNVINDADLDIFQDWDTDLWKKQMQELGGENLLWSNMPENPALN